MSKDHSFVKLYEVREDVRCCNCGCKGAVTSYGNWYERGIGSKVDDFKIISMEKYRNGQFMDHAMGFGGTIPWQCLNCGNIGLIDINGLEGFQKAFDTIK